MVRLATWNVNSVGARLERLTAWLRSVAPDVVCLQETKVAQDSFPAAECRELGYEAAAHGDGRWNGVAILSRIGLQEVARGFAGEPGFPAPEPRAIAATCGPLRVWSVYVPNGRALADPHLAYKLDWLRGLAGALRSEVAAPGALCACGDFNVAPTDADVWDAAVFEGSTHVSAAEREALAGVLDVGLADVLPRALKGEPFTYWDYRSGSFHKGHGMRIDLVLANGAAAGLVTDAYIDREARKGPRPSDHAPVVVDLDL